jgi:release factor glutamine methyltransferase
VGDEQFDVITANLPFRDKPAHDVVARSQWDTNFETNTGFFEQVGRYLKPGGRIYFAQASFGAIEQTRKLAEANGYTVRELDSAAADKAEIKKFFVYLIQRAAPVRPA